MSMRSGREVLFCELKDEARTRDCVRSGNSICFMFNSLGRVSRRRHRKWVVYRSLCKTVYHAISPAVYNMDQFYK